MRTLALHSTFVRTSTPSSVRAPFTSLSSARVSSAVGEEKSIEISSVLLSALRSSPWRKGQRRYVHETLLGRAMGHKLTEEELFAFDLSGFIVVKNVFSEAEIEQMNQVVDKHEPEMVERKGQLRLEGKKECHSPVTEQPDGKI